MNKLLQYSALAALVGAGIGVAHADEASTTGGIKVVSSDGKFDASLGGRIHFDGEIVQPDHGAKFGINNPNGGETSSFYFRRVFISLAGHLYGWEYHIDYDLAPTSSPSTPTQTVTVSGGVTTVKAAPAAAGTSNGFQDVYIAHSVFGSDTVYFGQHKPWRSLDELASNNITPFIERNGTSATGVYGGRDYAEGIFYKWTHSLTGSDNVFAGASFYSLTKEGSVAGNANSNGTATQGTGYNARVAYAPLTGKDLWAHIGAAYSSDNADSTSSAYGNTLKSTYAFVGRDAGSATLASYGLATSTNPTGPHVNSVEGELAGAFGPAYASAEYVSSKFGQGGGIAGNNVNAFSGTLAYAITGESRPYDKAVATYGSIKPKHSYGAVELAFRYDNLRNNGGGGKFVGVSGPAGITGDRVTTYTAGVNYYVNPAVRFMVNYMHGTWNLGAAGKDNPNAFVGRVALNF